MKKNRRDFIRYTGLAGMGLAGAGIIKAYASDSYDDDMELDGMSGDYDVVPPEDSMNARGRTINEKKVFIEAGKPLAVMGSAVRDIYQKDGTLIIPPDEKWGNPLFADTALMGKDFHIHARMTMEKFAGTETSFLIGGFYHYPCSRPEGNRTFRVSLDDDLEIYDGYVLETDKHVVYGVTEARAPWFQAKKQVVGKSGDYITPGEPFSLDAYQKGEIFIFWINGKEIFRTSLRIKGRIYGPGDSGWPACFGFISYRGTIQLHDLWAEGIFTENSLEHKDLWAIGHDRYCTYRIPSLCVTPSGSLLAFAEARRFDWIRGDWNTRNADEVHCVMKRSRDGGKTWSGQKIIFEHSSSYEARDPSPLVDRETGELFLITRGPYLFSSQNEGESWSAPRSLRSVLGGKMNIVTPGAGCHGIQLVNKPYKGRLIVPVASGGAVGLIYSDDHGRNWKLGGMKTKYGGVENHAIELEDGRVLLNSRVHHADHPGRLISLSNDGGVTFHKEYYDEQLPSHGCQASIIRYNPQGALAAGRKKPILFVGPGEARSRRNMMVKLSNDECKTWPFSSPVIYSGHTAYSAMEVLPDGQIIVLYEKDAYRRLSLVRFPLEWITGKDRM